MEAFAGPCPGGLEIRHLDGDAANNRLSNLAYGTSSENGYDITRHGRNNHANKTHCDNGHEFTPENTRSLIYPQTAGSSRESASSVAAKLRANGRGASGFATGRRRSDAECARYRRKPLPGPSHRRGTEALQLRFHQGDRRTEFLDPNFYVNWAMMKAVGIHRGAYHELVSSSSA